MADPVDLEPAFRGRAVEIEHVAANGMLATKLQA
jgi:hypothetical protein